MADSVVSGLLMMSNLSRLLNFDTDFLGYFGSRFLMRVLGLKKCTFKRFLDVFFVTVCFTAFATLEAFLLPPSAFEGSAPTPLFFGAIPEKCNLQSCSSDPPKI